MSNQSSMRKWLEIAPDLQQVEANIYESIIHGSSVTPSRDVVFRALELVSPEEVNVVILGQDPYHTRGKANGLAFGYDIDYDGPVNSSMANIISEVINSGYYVPTEDYSENRKWIQLLHWAEQGVLLLNTRLTVSIGRPMSHEGLGWEEPIRDILKYLVDNCPDIYWMLWGNEAHETAMAAGLDPLIEEDRVTTVTHPCRYSHDRGPRPFTGSRCFQLANEYLHNAGKKVIRW